MTVALNKVFNYARMTTATAGTGTITLGSAVTPFLTFAQAGVADGDIVYYSIIDGVAGCECGIGTYTASGTTLSRTTVLRSSGASNTGKITLSGAAEVHIEFLANATSGFLAAPNAGPTVQVFTSGTGATYTTPSGCTWIRIRLVGGGSGGGGGGTGGGGSSAGTASTWSGGSLSAGGAAAVAAGGSTSPTTGGTATGGNVANINGAQGSSANNVASTNSPAGGNSYFGGAGGGSLNTATGGSAATNSGSGGGAGPSSIINAGANSGACGGYVEHIITSPAATYTYTVGAGSAGGAAGTSGGAGGAGAAGIIIVEEYYN